MNSIPKGTKAGTYFSAKIEGVQVSGRIQIVCGYYYLCQNYKKGADCRRRYSFPFSWTVATGLHLKNYDVTDFKILDEKPIDLKPIKPLMVGKYVVIFQPKFVLVNDVKISHTIVRKIGKYQKLSSKIKDRLALPTKKMGGYIVKFFDEGIKVGCNEVSNKEIYKVIAYLNKHYPVNKK